MQIGPWPVWLSWLECGPYTKRCRDLGENNVDASSFYYIADDRV